MSPVRHLGLFVCLAFAIAFGQLGALRHELGHALQQLHAQGRPAQPQFPRPGDACEKCHGYSAFFGGLLAASQTPVAVASGDAPHRFAAIVATPRTVVATRSRAPPRVS